MYFLFSTLLLSFIILSRAENLFSSELDERQSDVDIFSSDEQGPLNSNLISLAGNSDEPVLSFADGQSNMDMFNTDPANNIPLENWIVAEGSGDPNQLQSSCETEGVAPNDGLQARSASCASTDANGQIVIPKVFQDPEGALRGAASNKPEEKPMLSSLDLLLFDAGGQCPPVYPIPCCSDYNMGLRYSYGNSRIRYFLYPEDCIIRKLLFLWPLWSVNYQMRWATVLPPITDEDSLG